jgi:2-polyprenyl-3-methyl-5-hydroxy-6-metoxy-1,4-benzoquinol methylase
MQNHWDERFNSETYVYGERPNAFIESKAMALEGEKKIVAFAEGEGRNAVFLARQGHHVTSWDYSVTGLKKTEQFAKRFNVQVETAQKDLIHDTVPSEKYDAAIMVFGHFPKENQKVVFNKLLSVVKPNGIILFEVYSEEQLRYQTGGPREKDMLYNPKDILDWIKEHEIPHFFYGEQEREEGILHTGKGHVIQAIVRKNDGKE